MTEQPKFTPEKLPIVVRDISDTLARDFAMGRLTTNELVARVQRDNPLIMVYAGLIKLEMLNKGVSPDVAQHAALGVLLTYEMLRRQAESNMLTENYNGGTPSQ